jgi:predicted secreted protein
MNYPGKYFAVFLAMIFLTLVWSSACNPAVQVMENFSSDSDKNIYTILTADDNGKEIKARVDDILRVDLNFQGGAGYTWYPDELNEKLIMLKDIKTEVVSGKNMVGGPMLGKWYFQVLAPGDTELKMLYYRTWEGKGHAIKKFELKLHIVGK